MLSVSAVMAVILVEFTSSVIPELLQISCALPRLVKLCATFKRDVSVKRRQARRWFPK